MNSDEISPLYKNHCFTVGLVDGLNVDGEERGRVGLRGNALGLEQGKALATTWAILKCQSHITERKSPFLLNIKPRFNAPLTCLTG
jgi:hypothetical protein